MLSFGQKVGLSAAGGALVVGVPAAFLFNNVMSPETLRERADEAHQIVLTEQANVTKAESGLPKECVQVLRTAAVAGAMDSEYNYIQSVKRSNNCGKDAEGIATKYWTAQHNVQIADQNAVYADDLAQPGAALPMEIATIATLALAGAAFGPMAASGALGNNVPSRQPAWL